MRAKTLTTLFLALVIATPAFADMTAATPAALAPLAALAGTWQAKGPDGKAKKATYEVNGTVVVEKLEGEGEPAMVTVYHADGDHLMLTHYCSIGNQPRMRAAVVKGARELDFKFVDGTNMKSPAEDHMHELKIAFTDPDHFSQVWTLHKGDQVIPMTLNFERVH